MNLQGLIFLAILHWTKCIVTILCTTYSTSTLLDIAYIKLFQLPLAITTLLLSHLTFDKEGQINSANDQHMGYHASMDSQYWTGTSTEARTNQQP